MPTQPMYPYEPLASAVLVHLIDTVNTVLVAHAQHVQHARRQLDAQSPPHGQLLGVREADVLYSFLLILVLIVRGAAVPPPTAVQWNAFIGVLLQHATVLLQYATVLLQHAVAVILFQCADWQKDAQGPADGELLREAHAHLLGQRELPLPRLCLVSLSLGIST